MDLLGNALTRISANTSNVESYYKRTRNYYYVCYLRGVTVDSTKLETMLRKSHDSTEGLIVQNNEVNSHCITVASLQTDVQPGS